MKTAYIKIFFQDNKQRLGSLSVYTGLEVFVCKTLELPYLDNAPNISSIPFGNYTCRWTRSNRLSRLAGEDVYTYEVTSVPSRTGIRIHSANYFFQLLGCVALGDAHKDINMDQELDIVHSGNTVKAFNTLMNKEEFILVIS